MRLQRYINEANKKPYILKKDYDEYERKMGLGPCGPISYVLREKGYGDIYTGFIGKKGDYMGSYPHFWIQKGGKIIDLQRELFKDKGDYWEIEKLKKNEKPDPMIWGKEDYDFWRERIHFK